MRRSSAFLFAALAAVAAAATAALSPQHQALLDQLPVAQRVELEQRQARWRALSPVEQAVYGQRELRWQALPEAVRRERRERWQAWRALPENERAQLRRAAADWAALPPERQRPVRAQFDALDGREKHGWLLGPTLGAEYVRLQPLLAFVEAEERARLLQTLREMNPAERADLAVLAQRVPPDAREALRRELLSTAAANRGEWLRRRLDQ
ncbi:DUF3106 domain-containing protein [Luteimonas gilva]|uniref:DUF3106 domain-containing protein n=1 Tax=Luteimonas gilva TaxID=2572684 RepID=A0A4U5JPT8_9GAMM|nr:DUF3106 domain-containing protein [Luteimonas gilva]TKR30418.1 DUF3106 domain-containing protein [Luteimonas gilva]